MSAKKTVKKNSDHLDLNFEEALTKIEAIVDSMESEELPLEDLVAKYEAGFKLLKHCDSVLASAKKRIELITLQNRDPIVDENSLEPDTDSKNNHHDSLF